MGTFKISKLMMKSLFKKPATLMYPVVKREWEEDVRGHVNIEPDLCILCSICAKKCPTQAISVEKENRTWEIDRMRCVQCAHCVEVCPKKCLHMEKQYFDPGYEKATDYHDIPIIEKVPADE